MGLTTSSLSKRTGLSKLTGVRLASAVALLALGLSACSRADAPSEADYDEVASGLGALSADDGGGDTTAMADAVVMLRGDVPFGLSASASGSIEGLHGGLMYEYELVCRDAAGAAMDVCSSDTDSGSLSAAWSGELDTPNLSGSIARTGSWQVAGLTTDVATFDGEGAFEVEAEWSTWLGGMRSYRLAYDASYEGVRVNTDDGAVVGGEARFSVVADRMATRGGDVVDAHLVIEAELTYHGDGTATLVLDGSHRYDVTLTSGRVERE